MVATHDAIADLPSAPCRALFVQTATFIDGTVRRIEAGAEDLRGHVVVVCIVRLAGRFLGTTGSRPRHSAEIVPSVRALSGLAVVGSVRFADSGRATETSGSDARQAQFGELFRSRYAVFIPTTHTVIHRQHLVEMNNHTFRRPGLVRLFE